MCLETIILPELNREVLGKRTSAVFMCYAKKKPPVIGRLKFLLAGVI